MHEVRVDKEKNRLYVSIGKLDGKEEIETIVSEIEQACGDLKKGFGCLTDLREYEVRGEEEEAYVYKAFIYIVIFQSHPENGSYK